MSSKTKAVNSKCPQTGALPPRIQEQTVSIPNPETNKYDCHFIAQTVKIAFYDDKAHLALLQVGDHRPVPLDAVQACRLWEVIQEFFSGRGNEGKQVTISVGETGSLVKVKPTADELGVLMAARDALDAHIDLVQRRYENG